MGLRLGIIAAVVVAAAAVVGAAVCVIWLDVPRAATLPVLGVAVLLAVGFAVLAGMVWALENPNAGNVETDEMNFDRLLEIQQPYLGPVKGYYTDWTPLTDRPGLFPEDIDTSDPWQFKNVLVR